MKVVYVAFDGTEFYTKSACEKYESAKTKNNIVMLSCNGEVVSNTNKAAIVWLKDEDATEVFHNLAKECGDEEAGTIGDDDYGVFYWDEGHEEYRWLSLDTINNLDILKKEVAAIGEALY